MMYGKSRYVRPLAGVIVFGSVWGFLECWIGDSLSGSNLPSGAIMTGFFGFGLMAMSRILYQQRGMQLGMGLVAGLLKFFHPIGGCMLCSAIAIVAEGAVFEMIWISPRLHFTKHSITTTVSMGIISGFVLYSSGYMVTQILTPLISSVPLSLTNFLSLIPSTLSTATLAGLAGATTLVTISVLPKGMASNLVEIRKEVYFPSAFAIAALCLLGILLL